MTIDEDMPLYDILNEFQKGHSHMAVVIRKNTVNSNGGTFGELKHNSYSSQTCIWHALS
jgi:CBS domain containing-hemolysin-like protein